MPSRPPTPTLFPYTTLFRSHTRLGIDRAAGIARIHQRRNPRNIAAKRQRLQVKHHLEMLVERFRHAHWSLRSEEHTSELQSLRHLVCRLLLEKKNKTKSTTT